jgi:hypothetical protein
VINSEAGLYIESLELAEKLTTYMATGVEPAKCYRALLGRLSRHAEPIPLARFVTGHEIAQCRHARQCLGATGGGYGKSAN